jgi:predicted ArsR family transcriptional regulator
MMKTTKLGARFFASTRGRIVALLRRKKRTVNELAAELELTDNAVRAQLLSLERDGLIRQSGIERGRRKPHFSYELTQDADGLFPQAYDSILDLLLSVLKEKLPPEQLHEVLSEVGYRAAERAALSSEVELHARAQKAVEVLETLGGAPHLEHGDGKLIIRSTSCPLAHAVEAHPESCQIAEALVSRITGAQVRERCTKTAPPCCSFEITEKAS